MLFNAKRGNTKAQIAVWVIVAAVIVVAGLITYAVKPDLFRVGFSKQKASQILETQASNLQDAIAYCVEQAAKYCFDKLGKHAGYYNYDFLSTIHYADSDKVVVMYKDAKANRINKLPSLEQILNREFQACMDAEGWEMIDTCVDFRKYQRYFSIAELKPRSITASSDYANDAIIINVDWPLQLTKFTFAGRVSKQINQKQVVLLLPLEKVWRVANDIVNFEVQQKNFIEHIESYLQNNQVALRQITFKIQNYPTYMQTIYMIETIPYRYGEEKFSFHFAVDRS